MNLNNSIEEDYNISQCESNDDNFYESEEEHSECKNSFCDGELEFCETKSEHSIFSHIEIPHLDAISDTISYQDVLNYTKSSHLYIDDLINMKKGDTIQIVLLTGDWFEQILYSRNIKSYIQENKDVKNISLFKFLTSKNIGTFVYDSLFSGSFINSYTNKEITLNLSIEKCDDIWFQYHHIKQFNKNARLGYNQCPIIVVDKLKLLNDIKLNLELTPEPSYDENVEIIFE